MPIRPRRSCLYMPGSNSRAIEKAKTLKADMLIFDLEDAVAPDAKVEARHMVCDAIKNGGFGNRETMIRINALSSDWGADDLTATVTAKPDGILAPKVETADDIAALDAAMDKAGADQNCGLWVMIEMPKAILHNAEIAAMAETTRLAGFVIGTNDLAKEMQIVPTPDRMAFQMTLQLSVIAARAYGLVAIDGVYNDIGNAAGLVAECEQGRAMGFDGKTLIHPSQLDSANQIFAPTMEQLKEAQTIVDAFALPENSGKAVIKVDGKMTELLHLEQAKQILAQQSAIESMDQGQDS